MKDRFVCSDASEGRGEGVVATASQVGAWLLVEVVGPWGLDAVADSELGPHVPDDWKADLKRRGIRPICIRPPVRPPDNADCDPDPVRLFFVAAGRPGSVEGAIWTRTVPALAAVRYVTDDLVVGAAPDGWEPHRERIVMVCTNGRHDQCCANRGRPVVRHLRASRWADQVWECSHIGGDRFAANVVVLPDSLYFGRMEPTEAESLLDDHAAGQIALEWYRGRSTLRFAEQAVEQAVRQEHGIRGLDDVVISPGSGPNRFRARVTAVGEFEVTLRRAIDLTTEPLTCKGTPNQKVPQFTVTDIVAVPDAGS